MYKAILASTFILLITFHPIGQRLQNTRIDHAVKEAALKFMGNPSHNGLSIRMTGENNKCKGYGPELFHLGVRVR